MICHLQITEREKFTNVNLNYISGDTTFDYKFAMAYA